MKVGEMAVKRINDWIYFFYIEAADFNYGSVVLHKAKKAIVFDTMECVANGKRFKDYLHDLGIDHFTVVNTHWHFDHIGGNSLYQADSIIATSKSRRRMEQNKKLNEMDIKMIIPPHGNLERYDKGGYDKSFIDNTINYLTKILSSVNEPNFLEGSMEEYITKAVESRESYRGIHQDNLAIVQQYYKNENM